MRISKGGVPLPAFWEGVMSKKKSQSLTVDTSPIREILPGEAVGTQNRLSPVVDRQINRARGRLTLKRGPEQAEQSWPVRPPSGDKKQPVIDYHHLIKEMSNGFALHEVLCDKDGHPVDYCFLDVNPAFERMTGLKAEDIVGKTVKEVLPGIESIWIERFGKVALTGNPDSFENYSAELGRYYDVRAFCPSPGMFAVTFNDVTSHRRAEKERDLFLRDTQDRVKELTCMFEVANAVQKHRDLDQLLSRVASIIPSGWQYPNIACARIIYGTKEYCSDSFAESPWMQSAELIVDKRPQGLVQLSYYEKRPKLYEGPFLKEERDLLDAIALTLSDAIELKLVDREYRRLTQELEQRVRTRTIDLEVANKELESFSYSVSHDLRSPLMAIDGFSQALIEDYGNLLDDTGLSYLNRVRSASQKMATLIDDLLKLSRLSRSDMKCREIDLTSLVKDVIHDLEKSDPDRKVKTIIRPNTFAWGDPRLLQILITNLIGNAWKFTQKTESPEIEFAMLEKAEKPTYKVRDNGAGFDMKYADRLFGAFQRLHTERDFKGTGIGLATVQRIIHRHGGRVWAQGRVGEGATFFFSLPVKGEKKSA